MRTSISPVILYIANKVAKIPGLKSLLKPFYYPYKDMINRNRNKVFKENALAVLEAFDRVMMENNIPYSVFAGTMLGAVREKGFIEHDLDIDTAVFYKDKTPRMREALLEAGFRLDHSFSINGGEKGLEETYIKDDVSLDIFYVYYDENHETYQCDFYPEGGLMSWEHSMNKYGYVLARKLQMPVSNNLIRVPFETIHVNLMNNYSDWLICRYGEDYMIPNPNFYDSGKNHFIVTNWERATFKMY